MLFWIFLAFALAPAVGLVIAVLNFRHRKDLDEFMWVFVGCLSALPSILSFCAWHSHASDISRVVAQEHRIEVYQERIESIDARLSNAEFPRKPGISVDADSPWASMIEALAQAETELAKAKDERAIAIRSIEARKRGPMSGVVSFVGDYEVN
jgi:hypothetical protein